MLLRWSTICGDGAGAQQHRLQLALLGEMLGAELELGVVGHRAGNQRAQERVNCGSVLWRCMARCRTRSWRRTSSPTTLAVFGEILDAELGRYIIGHGAVIGAREKGELRQRSLGAA